MMAHVLMGVECLLATLLWVALVVGWYARNRKVWVLAIGVIVSLLLLVPWGAALMLIGGFHEGDVKGVLWSPTAVFALSALAGVVSLWVSGLRRQPKMNSARATTWPLGRVAIFAIIATVLAQSTHWILDGLGRESLHAAQREAQHLGDSVSLPRIIDAENAAPLYEQVLDAMRVDYVHQLSPEARTFLHQEEPRANLDEAPEEPGVPDFYTVYWGMLCDRLVLGNPGLAQPYDLRSPRLAALLERNRGIVELLLRATEIPGCDFNRGFSHLTDDASGPLVRLRIAGWLLAIDARHAAANGNYERVTEDLAASYRLATHFIQEPWLLNTHISFSQERIANETLLAILANTSQPSEGVLHFDVPARRPALEAIARSMRIEEAAGVVRLAQLDEKMESGSPLAGVSPLLRTFYLEDALRSSREHFRRLHDLRYFFEPPTQQAFDRIDELEEQRKSDTRALVQWMVPAYGSAYRAALRLEAQRRQTHIAQGLYRYYHEPDAEGNPRREFPESLDVLVPDYLDYLPSDPFNNGKPMQYRLTEHGATVYSLGLNFKDDGGVPDTGKRGEQADEVLECLAPPAPAAAAPEDTPSAPPAEPAE